MHLSDSTQTLSVIYYIKKYIFIYILYIWVVKHPAPILYVSIKCYSVRLERTSRVRLLEGRASQRK